MNMAKSATNTVHCCLGCFEKAESETVMAHYYKNYLIHTLNKQNNFVNSTYTKKFCKLQIHARYMKFSSKISPISEVSIVRLMLSTNSLQNHRNEN